MKTYNIIDLSPYLDIIKHIQIPELYDDPKILELFIKCINETIDNLD